MERRKFEQEGRHWFRSALGSDDLAKLDKICAIKGRPGMRLEKDQDLSAFLGAQNRLHQLAQQLLPGARAVRAVIFNKTESENWNVPWHQDRVIAVEQRHDVQGFSSWTNKAGTWHVEPPAEILAGMMFARIHLDDTDETNGCLELALKSHKEGRVLGNDVRETATRASLETCRAKRGDVLFVKALTLHRSQRAQVDARRRTLRIDYCADDLPTPLMWAL